MKMRQNYENEKVNKELNNKWIKKRLKNLREWVIDKMDETLLLFVYLLWFLLYILVVILYVIW